VIWAAEAAFWSGISTTTAPPQYDCRRCGEDRRVMLGCRRPAPTVRFTSDYDDTLQPRDRCPKALLNADTDDYNPFVAEALTLAADIEDTGALPLPGGLWAQPAWVVDVLRLRRSVNAAMTDKWRKALEAKRAAG